MAISGAVMLWLCIQIAVYGGVVTRRHTEGEIKVVRACPISKWLNPHLDYENVLTFRGRKFRNLEGTFPYIVPIKAINAVMFVQGGTRPSDSAFVLLNLETGNTDTIRFGSTVVGTFGFGRRDQYGVEVEFADERTIVIRDNATSSRGSTVRYEIDVEERVLVKRK